MQSEIQDGSRRFFFNRMHYYVLFHVSYGHRYFLLVYFYKEYTGVILLRMSYIFPNPNNLESYNYTNI